jgi:LPXTG-site transpeptidase (sortase) family protein
MRAPARFSEVSWYAPGTVPGARGSAVFAGHVDNGLGLAGVFKHLDELNVGDDIYVEAEDGTTKHFVVAGRASYPYDAVPNDILFNRADTARLNLITCGGTFLPLARTYDRRLVVFAVLASSSPPTGEVSGTSPIYEGTGEISEGGGRSRMRDPRHRRA